MPKVPNVSGSYHAPVAQGSSDHPQLQTASNLLNSFAEMYHLLHFTSRNITKQATTATQYSILYAMLLSLSNRNALVICTEIYLLVSSAAGLVVINKLLDVRQEIMLGLPP